MPEADRPEKQAGRSEAGPIDEKGRAETKQNSPQHLRACQVSAGRSRFRMLSHGTSGSLAALPQPEEAV